MEEELDSAQSSEPESVDFATIVAVDPLELTDQQRRDWLIDTHRLMAQLDAATVAITGAFDTNLDWAADGAKSGASWISARAPIAHARAASDIHTARALRDTPHVADAARAGRLSRDHVSALLKARRGGLENAFAGCEQLLVDEVAESTVAAAHTFLRRWALEMRARLGINEPDGSKPGGGGSRSTMHLASTYAGRWDLQGNLDAETGELIANALDHQIDAMWHDGVFHVDDGLAQPERRAIAAAEIICRGTRGGDHDGTARPLVLGIISLNGDDTPDRDDEEPGPTSLEDHDSDLDTAEAPAADAARRRFLDGLDPDTADDVEDALYNFPTQLRIFALSRSGPCSAAALHKWTCEGDIIPITVGPDGDILRMGRAIRLANSQQRHALRVRDGGCQFPGCTVASEYCVAHHIEYWELGGPTNVENLVLLCRFHHDAVHKRRFTIARTVEGRWDVRRPGRDPVTPHLRIRPDLVPRTRPSADEFAMRRHARARIRDLVETGSPEWPRDEQGNRLAAPAHPRVVGSAAS